MKKANSLILLFLLIVLTFSGCTDNLMPENPMEENIPDMDTNSFIPKESNSVLAVSDYSEYSDKMFGFGYKKEEKGIVPSIGIYSDYISGMNAFYTGDTNQKKIYLTFDEGYENGYTAKILDTLKEKGVPAAFFCTGDYLQRNDELVGRMIKEGHIIGNHTWNHPHLPQIGDYEAFKKELTMIDDYLMEHHNTKTKYFRYPNGEFSKKSLAMIKDMGYTTVFWSLAYKDWERDVSNGVDYAVSQVMSQIHNGAIILLHAVSQDNADALGLIIDSLKNDGYEFVSLDELS